MPEAEGAGPGGDSAAALDTFPKLLDLNARRFADRHAAREKEYGIWQSWTWSELKAEIEGLACGLAALGFERGDRLAIIGRNRPRLYGSMCAAQALGGVPVPMYQDSVAKELQFVVDHAGVRFAIAEDQEQVDKLLELKEQCPSLEVIVYDDPRGMRHYDQPFLHSYTSVRERGRNSRPPIPATTTSRSRKAPAPIPPSSSTRRVPPATRRASFSPRTTS